MPPLAGADHVTFADVRPPSVAVDVGDLRRAAAVGVNITSTQ